MSQRIFTSNGVKVITGWDRPMNKCFLTIYNEDQEVIYSDLQRSSFTLSIGEVMELLKSFQLKAPKKLESDLLNDSNSDEINTFKDYDMV